MTKVTRDRILKTRNRRDRDRAPNRTDVLLVQTFAWFRMAALSEDPPKTRHRLNPDINLKMRVFPAGSAPLAVEGVAPAEKRKEQIIVSSLDSAFDNATNELTSYQSSAPGAAQTEDLAAACCMEFTQSRIGLSTGFAHLQRNTVQS